MIHKLILFTLLSLLTLGCFTQQQKKSIATAATKTTSKRPNIILVFADDISARELPIYGSSEWSPSPQGGNTSDPRYRAFTPVLSRLANEGVWIKTAWAATICSPSRAMMMTGRYAHLNKWWHLQDRGKWTNDKGRKETYPLYESSPHTIADVAKTAGYATMWAGKTQMEHVPEFGFDEGVFTPGITEDKGPYTNFNILQKTVNGNKVLVNEDTGEQVDYYAQSGWYWKPNVQLMNHPGAKTPIEWWPNTPEAKASYGLNTFGPDVELNYILDFMTRKAKDNKPFFVYHTTHLGHDGWDFLNSDINPKTRNKWPATPKIKWENDKYIRTQPNITGGNGNYDTHGSISEPGIHSHVNYLDYQAWQYINKMKELGIEDNTVFIFCADNGTSGYGKGSFAVQKGVHVPLIIYAPCLKMTKKGAQDVLANISDILPTIAELTGLEIPADYEVNGESLIPFLTSTKPTAREWIYAWHLGKQIVRTKDVLVDGFGKVYDVSKHPSDLISFPEITDWSKYSADYKRQYDVLKGILPRFDQFTTAHDAPPGGIGKVPALRPKK